MTRRTLARLTAGAGALALALVPSGAHGDEPFVTDRTADAVPGYLVCDFTAECVDAALSSPAIDIVTADLFTTGNTLTLSMQVLDLDSGLPESEQARYEFSLGSTTDFLYFTAYARRTAFADPTTGTLEVGWEEGTFSVSTPVTVDHATNTVTWNVSIDTLDAMRASACPDCAAIGRGTQLAVVQRASRRQPNTGVILAHDTSSSERVYTIGDR